MIRAGAILTKNTKLLDNLSWEITVCNFCPGFNNK